MNCVGPGEWRKVNGQWAMVNGSSKSDCYFILLDFQIRVRTNKHFRGIELHNKVKQVNFPIFHH